MSVQDAATDKFAYKCDWTSTYFSYVILTTCSAIISTSISTRLKTKAFTSINLYL